MADVTAQSSHSHFPIPGTPERDGIPTLLQLQANSITLSDDVLHLQVEMNDAMGHLLIVDTHQQKLISEMEITHHQNETKTSEAIKEIKAHYVAALGDAIGEAEAAHSASVREAEVICTTAVRKAEAASAVQTSKLQQFHKETKQTLEDEAIEEEKCACQSFLQACGATLQACPNEALGGTYVPHTIVNREHVPHQSSNDCSATGYHIKGSHPSPSCPRRPATTTHSTGTKQQHLPGCQAELDPSRYGEPISHPGEPPQ